MNARAQRFIDNEVRLLQDAFGTLPNQTRRVERKIAKAWLLDGFFMRNGMGFEPKAKSIGLGVYDLSVEEK